MTDPLAPDAGEVLRQWLDSLVDIEPTVGPRIGLSLTGPDPAIRYAQMGPGTNIGGGAVSVTYQIECWGRGAGAVDDGTSDLLARKILRAVPDFVGMIGGARVSGASAAYPYRSDDPETGRPRNIIETDFTVSP